MYLEKIWIHFDLLKSDLSTICQLFLEMGKLFRALLGTHTHTHTHTHTSLWELEIQILACAIDNNEHKIRNKRHTVIPHYCANFRGNIGVHDKQEVAEGQI